MSRPEGPNRGAAQRVSVAGLHLALGESPILLPRLAAERLGIPRRSILGWCILRRSLDARGRREPRRVFRLGVEVAPETPLPDLPGVSPWPREPALPPRARLVPPLRPVIVGAGPAGLFAALRLVQRGLRPRILERGAAVEERVRDVARFWRRGELDPESNVQFGEGGAGTFSDGKLTYRGKDHRKSWVFENLVDSGAPEDILYDARPHLGTDRLRRILKRLRHCLETAGCELTFGVRVEDLLVQRGDVVGVETAVGPVAAGAVFLAQGHSARDFAGNLIRRGVPAVAKGFAVGLRLEVPQTSLNECQYGVWAGSEGLPAAEFQVKTRLPEGRDVYSFCMCPGGVVIPAGSRADGLVVNGMSGSGRRGRWANAAIVVTVFPGDYGGAALGGFEFQGEMEQRAQHLGGRKGVPAQRVQDFLARRPTSQLPRSSCPWRPVAADLSQCLAPFAAESLRQALPRLIHQLRPLGEGLLIGVETRTSSPVRFVRGPDLQSEGFAGLYPVGEGAGYAGGIISSAIDGVRAADAYLERLETGRREDLQR